MSLAAESAKSYCNKEFEECLGLHEFDLIFGIVSSKCRRGVGIHTASQHRRG